MKSPALVVQYLCLTFFFSHRQCTAHSVWGPDAQTWIQTSPDLRVFMALVHQLTYLHESLFLLENTTAFLYGSQSSVLRSVKTPSLLPWQCWHVHRPYWMWNTWCEVMWGREGRHCLMINKVEPASISSLISSISPSNPNLSSFCAGIFPTFPSSPLE